MSERDHESVEAFERIMSNELTAAYGTTDRAFQREKTADGWRYWCAGTESAYEKFLAGWTAAIIAAQDSGQNRAALQSQDQVDAERYRYLSSMATQQADTLGPIFRIDVRRTPQTMFNFDAAVDHARRVEEAK